MKSNSLFWIRTYNFQRSMVEQALKECDGNQSKASRNLGITRSTLRKLLGLEK